MSYTPTSIMFMNVPGISKLQWHPFTISSSSNLEPEKLSVIIKSEGSWSKKLYQMLSSPSSVDHLDVSIEGPYGPASTNFLRYLCWYNSYIYIYIYIYTHTLVGNACNNLWQIPWSGYRKIIFMLFWKLKFCWVIFLAWKSVSRL